MLAARQSRRSPPRGLPPKASPPCSAEKCACRLCSRCTRRGWLRNNRLSITRINFYMSKALVIGTILGLPLFIAAVVVGPTAFDLLFHRQSPERFLVPSGYQGWARI